MDMEQNVIYLDRSTINGRTYTAECFASLPDTLLVTMGGEPDGVIPCRNRGQYRDHLLAYANDFMKVSPGTFACVFRFW
jgi:hypothetical protein